MYGRLWLGFSQSLRTHTIWGILEPALQNNFPKLWLLSVPVLSVPEMGTGRKYSRIACILQCYLSEVRANLNSFHSPEKTSDSLPMNAQVFSEPVALGTSSPMQTVLVNFQWPCLGKNKSLKSAFEPLRYWVTKIILWSAVSSFIHSLRMEEKGQIRKTLCAINSWQMCSCIKTRPFRIIPKFCH